MTTFNQLITKITNSLKFNVNKTTTKTVRKYVSSYIPITDHVYFNGNTFRVRFMKDGFKKSKNFNTRKEAIKFKKLYVA